MSIFGSIRDAIFGKKAQAVPVTPAKTGAPAAAPAAPKPLPAVDVEEVLTARASAKGQDLNWRSSIVDLMKVLDLDSSLAERKELARELGYTGELDGSAEMNIWLHKKVMSELARNGGKVPAAMLD